LSLKLRGVASVKVSQLVHFFEASGFFVLAHFFVGNANKKHRRFKIQTSFWRGFVGVRSASDCLGVGCGIAAVDFPKLQSLNVNEAVTKTLVMELFVIHGGLHVQTPLIGGDFYHGSWIPIKQPGFNGRELKSICLWFKIPCDLVFGS